VTAEQLDLARVEVGDTRPEEVRDAIAVVARAMSTSPMSRAVIRGDDERRSRYLTMFFTRLYAVARHQRPLVASDRVEAGEEHGQVARAALIVAADHRARHRARAHRPRDHRDCIPYLLGAGVADLDAGEVELLGGHTTDSTNERTTRARRVSPPVRVCSTAERREDWSALMMRPIPFAPTPSLAEAERWQ